MSFICRAWMRMRLQCLVPRMSWHIPEEFNQKVPVKMINTIGLVAIFVFVIQSSASEEALSLRICKSHVE
ncbi:hypothetical protein BDV37DRAFT_252552 [Aspergillus pseudonomiae]|uniref:Uncharacterized protein n=1 Tax=Aspergillus pseudonomiae TaxID=1506151 RepID=A0A5N7D8A6_9EURO|nr:uncharacterized protein BDV37DRAFT_252552 [Aspergillus pseudonomiae]KAE8402435.1 hypothetical protein BDV37DRAFT_252552 [Aspergillus pseudonomiae]